jgi:glycosyltransferase involved in cell wall biosynthesis
MSVWMAHLAGIGFDRLVPNCELFHATEHLLLPLHTCPTVLTVHDLIFNLFPERHKRLNRWYLNTAMPLFCRRADTIICVSENTKADLTRLWQIDTAKISVIHEAADEHFRPIEQEQISATCARYDLSGDYLITVGTVEPRKNLERLLDAVFLLRERGHDLKLVIVGQLGWLYETILDKLARPEYEGLVHYLGFVPDADLPALYSGAAAMVIPSLYEGFGLPVLESMACGTPVISSHAASLPELGGEAARYFDPHNVDEIASTIEEVWVDADLRGQMSDMGLSRVHEFSWERTAQETLDVYQSLSG